MRETKYQKLYQELKEMILDGKYQAHDKLPSKRKLALSLKLSPLTVQNAYEQLLTEGFIYTKEKVGYFVSEGILHVKPIKKSFEEKDMIEETSMTYDFAFRTNVVDTSLFPNATWAKLSREVLSMNYHEMLNNTHPQGILNLRIEIAKYLELYRGMSVDPKQIIIGSGSQALISMLVELLGRHKTYALEKPGYLRLHQIFKGQDVGLDLIPLDEQGISMEALYHTSANVIHITPAHQFPTGIVMPVQRRLELLKWASLEQHRYIIEDDYDSEFRFSGQPVFTLFGLDHQDHVIYMNSFTKTLAPSFRMGYIVLPQSLLRSYHMIEAYHGCTVPNFEQFIMYKFMKEGYFERHINRMRQVYKKKLDIMKSIIEKHDAFEMIGDEAGLHFILKIKKR
jgi:GntR family transcriptional regulator / MocR family aminotransferase